MSLLKLNSDFSDTQKVTKEKDYLQIQSAFLKNSNFQPRAVIDSPLFL